LGVAELGERSARLLLPHRERVDAECERGVGVPAWVGDPADGLL